MTSTPQLKPWAASATIDHLTVACEALAVAERSMEIVRRSVLDALTAAEPAPEDRIETEEPAA
jgi:hypothetical protein